MARPDVSVLVNTYQKPSHLRRCLVSLACQSMASRMEVIIVDDGSLDETGSVVRSFAKSAPFPVKYLSHPHDGFQLCRCRNEGAAAAASDNFIFFDGDLVAPRAHIAEHLRHLQPGIVTNSHCVRLSREISDRIDEESIAGGQFVKLAPWRDLVRLASMQWKARFYSLIRHPSKPRVQGGDLGVTRADFERVNGFDENFRAWGGEDDDFGFRLRAVGVRPQYILSSTRSYHLWHPPALSKPDRMRDGLNESYLHRKIRLSHCLHGLQKKTLRDLKVRLCGISEDHPGLVRVLRAHFQWPQSPSTGRVDLEVVPWPGEGRFTRQADCNVLVVTDRNAVDVPAHVLRNAQLVLSPLGLAGTGAQVRLRLDDVTGIATALGAPAVSSAQKRRAA